MFLHPIIAPISPTAISDRIYVSSAFTLKRPDIRSFSFKVAFLIFILFLRIPLYTLKNVTGPFSLSFTTLKARAQSFPFADGALLSYLPVAGLIPRTVTCSGEGRYLMTPSSKGYIPLFLSAEPQSKATAF
jgi:hypothetical protein